MSTTVRSNGSLINKRPFKVLVCLVTLAAFLFNTVSYDLVLLRPLSFVEQAWAVGKPSGFPDGGSARAGGLRPSKGLRVGSFTLPEYLGRIKETWQSSSRNTNPVIVHIQDAHCNYACQQQIAKIIEYINREYGVDTINLEGGAKDYDISIFTDIKDKILRDKASDYFVKEGLVNGAEYFAANNPDKIRLWGVEDTKLYIDNLSIYRNSLLHKEEVDKYLKSLSYILSNLKIKVYSKDLLDFDMKYGAYKAGNMDFKEYLSYLLDMAKAKGIEVNDVKCLTLRHSEAKPKDLKEEILRSAAGLPQNDGASTSWNSVDAKKLPNIYYLAQSLSKEGDIDFRKANGEQEGLIDSLQKKLSKNALEELVVKTIAFKQEHISQKDFYDYLLAKATQFGVDIKAFSEFQKYKAYISVYDAVDKTKVMEEVDSLGETIKSALYRNDKEKELSLLSKNFAILKNIFNILLTKDDYRYYKDHITSFETKNYLAFINNTVRHPEPATKGGRVKDLDSSAPFGPQNDSDNSAIYDAFAASMPDIARLDHYRDEISKFYEYSLKRDDAFVKNVRFAKPVEKGLSPKAAILITGGFHTENLAELFRKQGVSYISIMPNFKNTNGYQCPYFKILSGENDMRIVDAMPSVLKNILAPPDQLNPAMMEAMSKEVRAFPSERYLIPQASKEKPVHTNYEIGFTEQDIDLTDADFDRPLAEAILKDKKFVAESLARIYDSGGQRRVVRAVVRRHSSRNKIIFEINFELADGRRLPVEFIATRLKKDSRYGRLVNPDESLVNKHRLLSDKDKEHEFTPRFGAETTLDDRYHVFSTELFTGVPLNKITDTIEFLTGQPGTTHVSSVKDIAVDNLAKWIAKLPEGLLEKGEVAAMLIRLAA